jgi:transposase
MKNSRLNQSALDQTLQQALNEEILPFDQRLVQLTQKEHIQLKWQANFWKTQHERSIAREEILKEQLKQQHKRNVAQEEIFKEQIKQQEAAIKDLNQRLYGKKSEKNKGKKGKDESNPNAKDTPSKRTRGQQKESKSHGRTKRPNLPVIPEVVPVSETACGACGLEYSILSSHEESEVIEVQVAAHVRQIKRQKCVKNCNCTPGAKIITAPAVPKLIPKSLFGNSVWVKLLLQKFLHAQPVNRTLNDLKSLGLAIAPGTVAGGLQKLTPLFEPIYKAFHQQQMTEK